MGTTNDIYNNYNGLTRKITVSTNRMAEVCESLEMKEQKEALLAARDKLDNHKFSIGILGEFKRGKSTVINALLGKEVMPADIKPCSATMNRVTYGLTPSARLDMVDGTQQEISVDELKNYVTKLDSECDERSSKVNEAVVCYPCPFCQNGVDIVDTPGLNDDERMNRITEEVIPKLDAVIMVTVPGSPFSMSESEFVRNKLMCSDVSRLIFLVNKIDTVRRKSDRVRIVEDIKGRIKESVLEKTKSVYGADSEQYAAVESKLADIRVFPISAFDALEGRLTNDEELVEKSGMLQFEEALSKMLTEERGMLELTPPLIKTLSAGKDALNNIHVMQGSLEADGQAFVETQSNVKQEVEALKERSEEQVKHLRVREKEVEASLSGKMQACYNEMQTAAMDIIDAMSLEPNQMKDEQKKNELIQDTVQKIETKIKDVLSLHGERIVAELNAVIEDEGSDIAANIIAKSTMDINNQFENITLYKPQNSAMNTGTNVMAVALETVTSYVGVFGVGGLMRGYRVAGVKGALVGGVAGAAITYGAVIGLAALTGPIGLPLVILTSVAGTFGGGKIAEVVFGKGKAKKEFEELKGHLREEVSKSITEMRANHELETWVQTEVTTQFESLISDMEVECERIANDAERKLSDIKRNIYANATERKHEQERLEELEKETVSIYDELNEIYEKLKDMAKAA